MRKPSPTLVPRGLRVQGKSKLVSNGDRVFLINLATSPVPVYFAVTRRSKNDSISVRVVFCGNEVPRIFCFTAMP